MSDAQSLIQNQNDGNIGDVYQSVVVDINRQHTVVDQEHFEIKKDRRPGPTCSFLPVVNTTLIVILTSMVIYVIVRLNHSGAVGIDAEVHGKLDIVKVDPVVHQASHQALTDDTLPTSKQEDIHDVFELDQNKLKNLGFVRWIRTEDSKSITPSENDSCVEISHPGLYAVFSQITFRLDKLSPDRVSHSIIVKRNETDESTTQIRLLDIPQMRVGTHSFFMPSNINVVISVKPREKVCVMVYPADMVYVSAVHNILTVVRLNALTV
ncbi:uncharacterized protein LOC127844811 [Dreissena polymorpha]|uniref:TNF family profile domain-containing protein n=1 Tax=Dreissena polymorpha TaxID=45954 RepID=A0A9D4EGZ1_DREPO|nr:uncharacterized protein LOC127844811 [Dreissena polymorpha]KAH3778994.1 hypothetical protein DPMN_180473 [Dreissena polymorpha]